jgi:hypothetical protein
MRHEMLAIAALFPLMAGQPAWAQHTAQPGDAPAAAPDTADPPKPADPRPEQAGDLYQASTRTGGITPPAKQDDPLPGALDAPVEPLSTGRPSEAKN